MQDKLVKIKEYFQSLEQYEGKWVVCVNYKEKWGAYSSDDGKINAIPDEKVPCRFWYIANDKSITLDDILDLISETVETNIDALKKAELFKVYISKLKVLFSSEEYTYNDLSRLTFTFNDVIDNTHLEDKVATNTNVPTTNSKSVLSGRKSSKKKTTSKKDVIKQLNSNIDTTITSIDNTQSSGKLDESNYTLPEHESNQLNVPVNENIDEFHEARKASDLSKSEIDDLRG
jgi:hypothetical protein